jgi:diadenosine tetraphosphate (Ap4A) HIT family hydrolase
VKGRYHGLEVVTDLGCPFCSNRAPVLQNALAFARFDQFPVSPGHLLVIPFRHISSYFDLTDDERDAMTRLVVETKELLDARHRPDGYNIGINVGEAAGQSVWHVHIHVIPRYTGDVPNPRGGVRGVIPLKQNY